MTHSRYEQRVLDQIETSCSAEDPAFVVTAIVMLLRNRLPRDRNDGPDRHRQPD